MRVLVTGTAGFIGRAVALRLLERGDEVVGVDCLTDYYDVRLKQARLATLTSHAGYKHYRCRLEDRAAMERVFADHAFDGVVNLAAQPGVRHSIEAPESYVSANLEGFLSVLQGCREQRVGHLVYASTSSVYGLSTKTPYREQDDAVHPVSFYAATKRANELMAHSYAHLFGLPCTGLRFFTVYGPWARPDMALFKFTEAILRGETIPVYNHGNHRRDWTYVDDIAEGVVRALDRPPRADAQWDAHDGRPDQSSAPFRVFNIGSGNPVRLMDFIDLLEQCIGKPAKKEMLPMQQGDVHETNADVAALRDAVGYRPDTPIEQGVERFVRWYRDFYSV